MKRRQQAIHIFLAVLLFDISSVLCQIKLITEGDRSVCVFSENLSNLKTYSITTNDGLSCDVIGNDDNCKPDLKSRQVITGICELNTSFVLECFVNRSYILNECCTEQNFRDCSRDKTCFPLADVINGSKLSITYDSTPYASGKFSCGTTATFVCPTNLHLVGQNSSTCKNGAFHPTPPSCETPPPILLKFQSPKYDATEGSDAQIKICLNVSNGSVSSLTGINISVNLETELHAVSLSQKVHFSMGSDVGCTNFSMTSLKAGQYTVKAKVLSLPVDSPSVDTTDSATLTVHKRGLSEWMLGIFVTVVVFAFVAGIFFAIIIRIIIPLYISYTAMQVTMNS